MGDDFGVGLALEGVAATNQQSSFSCQVVFDDAVVDNDERAGLVGMGVGFRRAAVGRPAGVADADAPLEGIRCQPVLQIEELAFAAPHDGLSTMQGADAR
jgi:hypothetical protein